MGKPAALLWHRWFGVLGGAWLLLIALTGSVLVFYGEIDRALNPDLFRARSGEVAVERPAVAAAIRAVEARWPGAKVDFARLPQAPGDTLVFYTSDRPETPGAVGKLGREVYADPMDGVIQGSRAWGALRLDRAHVMPFLYKLHYSLHAGETVVWLLGVLSLLWLVDHVVAVPLAVRSAKRWPGLFRLRRGATGHKLNFDLHRAAALWLLPVTAVLAFTGVYFNLHDEFKAALSLVSKPTSAAVERAPVLPAPVYAPSIDADAALARVSVATRGAEPTGLAYDPTRAVWTAYVRHPKDVDTHFGGRTVTLDARSGALLGDHHPSWGTAGDVVLAWQYPLHSGKVFGWPGRVLVLLAGVATCSLVLTGYAIWAKKALARRGKQKRRLRALVDAALPLPAE